ncbi:MAG: M14 family zinc carboxypeptidase, partial [Thermoproteota archaeon]
MPDILGEVIEHVPSYNAFMTVEELDESAVKLAEKYPDVVKLLDIGTTREGDKIYALRIGKGKNKALLFGCPHPNEPVGTLVLEYLSWELAKNDKLREVFDYTWYIVKVADKEGLRLNSGWLKGPFTPLNYAKN